MKYLFYMLCLTLLLLCGGCSEQSSTPQSPVDNDGTDYVLVDMPFMEGTIKTLIATTEPEKLIPEDPGNSQMSLSDSYYNLHRVKIMWGRMFQPLPDTNYLDMSGRLSITPPGVVALGETIDFENDDYILSTNDTEIKRFPQYIQWVAHITEVDSDGLILEIFSAKNYLATVVPQMIVDIYGQTFVFDFNKLDEMDTVIALDTYNDLWIQSKRIKPDDCLKGRLAGTWVHKNFNSGYFYGVWYAVDYTSMGYLAGEFITGNDGRRVFKGGWCDCLGVFQGYLKGTWEYDMDAISVEPYPNGIFKGVFTDSHYIVRGHLHGEFGHFVDDVTSVHKYARFKGYWSTCNATDQIID